MREVSTQVGARRGKATDSAAIRVEPRLIAGSCSRGTGLDDALG